MNTVWWVSYLSPPCCGIAPSVEWNADTTHDFRLMCPQCERVYSVEDGVVRFGETSAYASSFGLEWTEFAATQIDHRNGTTISRDRLAAIVGGALDLFEGAVVYDAGCGSGRFAAIAAQHGAKVIAADLSLDAVRACRENTHGCGELVWIHTAEEATPVRAASVDIAMTIGVYQHAPVPEAHLRAVAETVRPGGKLLFWGYERRLKSLLHPKYVLRPLTRRLPPRLVLRAVRRTAPALLRTSDQLHRLPHGRAAARIVPIANYRNVLPLDDEQTLEWAVLDTVDWLSPRYDRPMTESAVRTTLGALGFRLQQTTKDGLGFVGVREAS